MITTITKIRNTLLLFRREIATSKSLTSKTENNIINQVKEKNGNDTGNKYHGEIFIIRKTMDTAHHW